MTANGHRHDMANESYMHAFVSGQASSQANGRLGATERPTTTYTTPYISSDSQDDATTPRASGPTAGVATGTATEPAGPPTTTNMRNPAPYSFEPPSATSKFDPDLVAHIKDEIFQDLKAKGVFLNQTQMPYFTSSRHDSAPTTVPIPTYIPHSPTHSAASTSPKNTPPSPTRWDNGSGTGIYGDAHDRNGSRERYDCIPRRSSSPRARPPPPASEPPRPKPVIRMSTGDATTLEKVWQPLFDQDGNPTKRLSQVLRGLALNMIEDYEPCNSLVISPAKMMRFYAEHKVSGELYSWETIFGGKLSNSDISHLYRDLGCQHHFVQKNLQEKPNIPALTEHGFDVWMTKMIRAHPDLEYDRLTKAIQNLPISNADDRRERFPKELSRRLFPGQANLEIQDAIADSMDGNGATHLSRQSSSTVHSSFSGPPPPPPTTNPYNMPPTPVSTTSSYSQPQTSGPYPMPPPPPSSLSASASDRATPAHSEPNPPAPIERQRQPYTAQPGGGKVYEDAPPPPRSDNGKTTRSSTISGASRPAFDHADTSNLSSSSSTSQQQYPSQSQGIPLRHARTNSTIDHGPPAWKQRSPSRSRANTYTRSDTDVFGTSYGGLTPTTNGYANGPNGPSNLHIDDDELARQYSRDERDRRGRRYTEDDAFRTGGGLPPPPPPQHSSSVSAGAGLRAYDGDLKQQQQQQQQQYWRGRG